MFVAAVPASQLHLGHHFALELVEDGVDQLREVASATVGVQPDDGVDLLQFELDNVFLYGSAVHASC